MKATILILMGTLLLVNAAFAIDDPVSAKAPDGPRVTQQQIEDSAPTPPGRLDLRNIPEHLRWLVQLSWMMTYRTAVFSK